MSIRAIAVNPESPENFIASSPKPRRQAITTTSWSEAPRSLIDTKVHKGAIKKRAANTAYSR